MTAWLCERQVFEDIGTRKWEYWENYYLYLRQFNFWTGNFVSFKLANFKQTVIPILDIYKYLIVLQSKGEDFLSERTETDLNLKHSANNV